MLIISIVGVQCRKYSAISCFWTSWKGSKTLQYFEMKEAFFRLSPGQTRILGVDVYENWQARVCMRVFSTLVSRAWSGQTRRVAVRVDERGLDVGARPWRKLSSILVKVDESQLLSTFDRTFKPYLDMRTYTPCLNTRQLEQELDWWLAQSLIVGDKHL